MLNEARHLTRYTVADGRAGRWRRDTDGGITDSAELYDPPPECVEHYR